MTPEEKFFNQFEYASLNGEKVYYLKEVVLLFAKEYAQMKVESFWNWYCNHPNHNIDNEYTKEEMFEEFFKQTS